MVPDCLMDLPGGTITIDGANITRISQQSLRKAIGVVPQVWKGTVMPLRLPAFSDFGLPFNRKQPEQGT